MDPVTRCARFSVSHAMDTSLSSSTVRASCQTPAKPLAGSSQTVVTRCGAFAQNSNVVALVLSGFCQVVSPSTRYITSDGGVTVSTLIRHLISSSKQPVARLSSARETKEQRIWREAQQGLGHARAAREPA